ncbi:hypothetical protein NMY22_g4375 [Coprinellus aureogranulatus]|nr:hypothetical protein NMY22_g4375 [Coprinellus aureogranulatus]
MAGNVLVPRCNVCKSPKGGLSLCGGCRVARYCSKDHQLSDWPTHKSACGKIKRGRAKLEMEDNTLRSDAGGGIFNPAYPFENKVGSFWGILSTRDYMRARLRYAVDVLDIDSHDALTTALDHMRDMLRLNRRDNQGVRDRIPSILLRLGQDQKCYDFVKWYATEGARGDYSYGDLSLPFLNLENEDAMEAVAMFCDRWAGATHAIPVTLLKVRMLLDLQDLRSHSSLFETSAVSHFDPARYIKEQPALRSSIWKGRLDLLSLGDLDDRMKVLENQTNELFRAIQEVNEYIWDALAHPELFSHEPPSEYSPGSLEETTVLLLENEKSWVETDGALEWIRNKL